MYHEFFTGHLKEKYSPIFTGSGFSLERELDGLPDVNIKKTPIFDFENLVTLI